MNKRKKKIAFVVNGLYGGGAERVLQLVLGNLDLSRYDITLISHRQDDANGLYPADIRHKHILKSRSRLGSLWVRVCNKLNLIVYENFPPHVFRALYLRERFDVEVAFIEGYATRIVAGGRSARKIAWVHIDLKNNPWTDVAFRSREEQRECYRRFERVVCVSQSVRETFDELFPGSPSEVVYNPVDSEGIRRGASLGAIPREKGVPLFVSAGRLVEQKGYDRLIPITGRLVEEGFNLRLWIVGEGAQRKTLEKLIAEWGLGGMVTLWGWRDNPWPWMAEADWYVLSSRWEGYGLVMAEALILGTPVVAVECAGTRELLGDSKWGIVVENDDDALLDAMRKILQNPALRKKYRARAAERGEDFSLRRQMDDIHRIIEGDKV